MIRSLRIIYFALLFSMLSFTAVCYVLSTQLEASITDDETKRTFLIACLFLAAACISISGWLLKKDTLKIREMETSKLKLESYRGAAIRSYALIEGAALLAIVGFFLTHNEKLLIVVGLLVVSYLLMFPSASKIGSQIGESEESLQSL